MKAYDTVTEALSDLKKRGYTLDFNLIHDGLHCKKENIHLKPEDFHIRETYRFEGSSNPSDEEVVFAIESKDGLKGVLVDAFGTYAESLSEAMVEKLQRN